jgi:isopentenyl diphosphate isomerase/L-lactate dehydrogenase-like FMN-dependent dehydrogenase
MSFSSFTTVMHALLQRDKRSALQKTACVADIRALARKKVPGGIFDFVDGGASNEVTLEANESDFNAIKLLPKSLIDVSLQDTTARFGGRDFGLPFYFGPAGLIRVVGNGGELSAVKAAGKNNIPYTISTSSSYSIEEIRQVASGPLWFQLYLWRNKEVVDNLINRAEKAGCEALVLTVDVPLNANRLRDLRNGMSIPPKISFSSAIESALRPRWLADILSGEPIGFRNFMGIAEGNSALSHSEFINRELSNLSANWNDLSILRERWKKKIYIKGILTAEDALKSINCGVDGIIVSNHGGRQLDSTPSSISVLPSIVNAVEKRCDVILDGGVRSGLDVVKAICLGANAVSIARPWVFGVAAGGEAGVNRVIEILRQELTQTLALIGASSVSDLDRRYCSYPKEWG